MKAIECTNKSLWEVPYLPIDPQDVGSSYEAIIRINSQSGKGGIAYVREADYGLKLPRNLQIEMRNEIQRITDAKGKELSSSHIHERFMEIYITQPGPRFEYVDHHTYPDRNQIGILWVEAKILDMGNEIAIQGSGNGLIDGFVGALGEHAGIKINIIDYSEHTLGTGSNASAVCYMEIEANHQCLFGVGINPNITIAPLEATVSA